MTATQQNRLNRLRAMFARAAHTTSEGEADTAARMAREWMHRYGFTQDDVTGGPWARGTEADYILHNFRTAKARWDRMDRDARQAEHKARTEQKAKESTCKAKAKRTTKAKAETSEPGYRLIQVKGHWRTSKTGKRFWVGPHARKVKVKA